MNIITGASKRGKTAVFDIIDYCLGSTSYQIPGVIRTVVSKFALELQTPQGVVVVARDAPRNGKTTTSTMHVSFRTATESAPPLGDIESNSDLASAREFISRVTGIDDNRTDVGSGSRTSFQANIRHSLYFVFQGQSEIANRDILFHSQGDEWAPQAIRDVFPYFLGVVDPEQIWKQQQLRALDRELRVLRRNIGENDAIRSVSGRATALLTEAMRVGLVSASEVGERHDILQLLTNAVNSDEDWSDSPLAQEGGEVSTFLEERAALREQMSVIRAETKNLNQLLSAHLDYNGEAREQKSRLASLGLLKLPKEADEQPIETCPVCESTITNSIPGISDIRSRLLELEVEISDVSRGVPHIQELLGENEVTIQGINQKLRLNQDQLDSAVANRGALQEIRDRAVQRASTRGRISLYLESMSQEVEHDASEQRLAFLQEEIDSLREQLDLENVAERLQSALSRISLTMTSTARELELEHADSPVRLDIQKLTIVVDMEDGPRVLSQMGSGANWVGYHLTALIGLHQYFVENNRPVPRFMCLDQPSQTYFPADPGGNPGEGRDEDSQAVLRLIRAVNDLVESASGQLQVIITEHADFSESLFQDAVIARWRGSGEDSALVPPSWL